jgi:hypothetical protein
MGFVAKVVSNFQSGGVRGSMNIARSMAFPNGPEYEQILRVSV